MKKRAMVLISAALVFVMLIGMATAAYAAPGDSEKDPAANLTRLFTLYAPEDLAEFIAMREEHSTFHEGRQAQREQAKERAATTLESLISALIDGEMTLDEAKAAFSENREKIAAMREELAVINENKQTESAAIKAQAEAVREQIKTALAADEIDAAQMADLLSQTLTQLRVHIDMDYKYADQVDAVIDTYYPAETEA